ncbi:somatostatin receptor type 5-like [Diadema antillarum]|uniref:somatostatin receptor type 5-like n=1 Tax=Diadema antillarum TaxID=105358 RepID=UPI003A8919B7
MLLNAIYSCLLVMSSVIGAQETPVGETITRVYVTEYSGTNRPDIQDFNSSWVAFNVSTVDWDGSGSGAMLSDEHATGDEAADPVSPRWRWLMVTWSPWNAVQLGVAVVGVFGNALVIAVLFKRRAANRVTDTLVASLAAADLLTSLFTVPVPRAVTMPTTWLGQLYCKMIHSSMLMWSNIGTSTYLLLAISVERYLAVAHPMFFSLVLSRRQVHIAIAVIWIANYTISLSFGASSINVVEGVGTCTITFASTIGRLVSGYGLFIYRLLVPTLVMIVTQALIIRKLYQQTAFFRSQKREGMQTSSSFHVTARNRVLRLMMMVIITYVICWTPPQLMFLLYSLGIIPRWYPYSIYHRSLTLLGFCNSCANPIIYTIRFREFREALVELFTGKAVKKPLFGTASAASNGTNARGTHDA